MGETPNDSHEPNSPASYLALSIVGEDAELEMALALLLDEGCLGSHSEDGALILYFEDEGVQRSGELVRRVESAFPQLSCRSLPTFPEEDWAEQSRALWTGGEIGAKFYALPSWLEAPKTDRHVLRIDPKRAFGTGSHETTRGCASNIETISAEHAIDSMVDVGCGTGILAIIGAFSGVRSVLALEPDPDAHACAIENVRRHAVEDIIEVQQAGFEALESLEGSVDLIVANLHLALLEQALPGIRKSLSSNGVAVLSGILVEQATEIRESIDVNRLREVSHLRNGDWLTFRITPRLAGKPVRQR